MRFLKLLFSVLLVFGLCSAGVSVSNYTISKSTFQPGDIGVATITVVNPTGSDRVTGLAMTIYNPSDVTVTSAPKLADIESGGTAIVSIPMKFASKAKPGVYLLNVEFTGFSGNDKVTNTISVPITIADLPIVSLNADTKVLSGVDPLSLTITNNGGPASQMRLMVSNVSDIALFGLNELYVGGLKTSKKLNLTIDARSASDGPNDIPFIMTYNDEIGSSHTETVYLRLTVKKEKLDLKFNQLSSLTTREGGSLKLEVTNNGEDISDVRIAFTNDTFRLKDLSELKVGNLSSGEKTTVSGKVYPTLSPGLNLVNAKVTWTEKDIRKEQTMKIPLTITSDSDVGVYLESKPSPLTSAKEHTVSVLVSNLGSYAIDNVDVGLSSTAFALLDITPRQYIGSLEQDDFSTVQFKVKTNGVTGSYPINVNVRYRDASGGWVNKTITQSAQITAPVTTGNGMLTLIVVLVVVAAILVWYFKFRKKG